MPDKFTYDYVQEERERCAQLCEALQETCDRGFLAYCIRAPVMPNEIDHWRQRYAETSPVDDVEDLM